MHEDALRVTDLYAGYVRGLPIVNGVSLELRAGEILAVFGPNGAGKSTMVRAIAGIVRIFAGSARSGGRELAGLPPWQIARAGVAYVPQRANVFAEMTVTENLALGSRSRGDAPGVTLDELLALFPDLAQRGEMRVGALSGGQRQMVAIGRALLSGPRVMMLDEPSAGLAPKMVGTLFAALARLKARVPILLVEQNVKAALTVADRALLLAEGRLLHEAAAGALASDPALAAVFFGYAAIVTASVLVDGVFLGSILCLASLGLSLTYAVFRFPNFAHGDLITVAGYGAWAGASAGGVWVGAIAAVLAAVSAALLADRLALRGLLARGDAAAAIIGSFAIGLILRNLVVLLFGFDATESLTPLEIATPVWNAPLFREARLTTTEEAVVVGTTLLILLGQVLLRRTALGRDLRAVAENPELAGVCGIVVPRVRMLAWCLAALSCAAAGIALIMLGPMNPETGAEFMLPALAAVIAGGLGSLGGTLAGAALIGMAESVSVHFNLAEWRQVFSFLIIILVLCLRPAGLAGRPA